MPNRRVNTHRIKIGTTGYIEEASLPVNELVFHSIVLGRTGTGKSNFLKLLYSSISKIEGSNIILVDFHGTLSREIITLNHQKELIFISPGDPYRTGLRTRLNVLKGSNDSPVMLYNIQKIFSHEDSLSSGTWGPRLQTVMTTVLREVVLRDHDSTLSDFLDTLVSRESMNQLISGITGNSREVIKGIVKRWEYWIEYSMSTVNKLLPILSDPEISQIVSSRKESLNIQDKLSEGNKLLVLDVSKTEHSEQQGRVVASMLLNRIWADILKNGMSHKTILMVDESQNLNSSILSEILSEGRKFNFFIILASQYLGQHNEDLINAIMSNCGNFYAFNMSEEDCLRLCKLIPEEKTRRRVINSILMGPVHDLTHISNLQENGISVKSYTPSHMHVVIDQIKYKNLVIDSLEKYGSEHTVVSKNNIPLEITPHRRMQEKFRDYLEKKSITANLEEKTGETRADIIYHVGSTPIMVEVELYDTTRFERCIRKACNYSNSHLVFLCAEDQGLKLYGKFKDIDQFRRNLDRMRALGEKTFLDMEKISIVEERKKNYFLIKDGKYHRWMPQYAIQRSSFSLNYETYGNITLNIIREMKISGSHEYRLMVGSEQKSVFLEEMFT